jgi:hypothetical protein
MPLMMEHSIDSTVVPCESSDFIAEPASNYVLRQQSYDEERGTAFSDIEERIMGYFPGTGTATMASGAVMDVIVLVVAGAHECQFH